MRTIPFPAARDHGLPIVGQGTWRMGERTGRRRAETDALRLGIDLGMTLIDTAEMYGGGVAEEIVGEAIRGRRDEVFLVSKVLPENASPEGTARACERSLARLGTQTIDLYLLHWKGRHPLDRTLEAFERLRESGKIRAYGVSNFDRRDMERAVTGPHGDSLAANQVLYNMTRRGIEQGLLPWCVERKLLVMAYSPIEQGALGASGALAAVARRHQATTAQIAIAWTIRRAGVVTIPKAVDQAHVRENAAAASIVLEEEDLAEIDRAFPPPKREGPLEVL